MRGQSGPEDNPVLAQVGLGSTHRKKITLIQCTLRENAWPGRNKNAAWWKEGGHRGEWGIYPWVIWMNPWAKGCQGAFSYNLVGCLCASWAEPSLTLWVAQRGGWHLCVCRIPVWDPMGSVSSWGAGDPGVDRDGAGCQRAQPDLPWGQPAKAEGAKGSEPLPAAKHSLLSITLLLPPESSPNVFKVWINYLFSTQVQQFVLLSLWISSGTSLIFRDWSSLQIIKKVPLCFPHNWKIADSVLF